MRNLPLNGAFSEMLANAKVYTSFVEFPASAIFSVKPPQDRNPFVAQKVITQLVDDVDGSVLSDGSGETVRFSLDGTSYEIDLSKKNADKLRAALQSYIEAGRKVGRRTGNAGRRSQSGPSAKELRDWARSNGFKVPDRGRIPGNVREAFEASSG